MVLSDNLTVVALVISLVALVLSSGQAIQQFLGTAEGYRRCAKAVIGPWHRLRWRHFVWTEFRYETHFITPELMLLSHADIEEAEDQRLVLSKVDLNRPIKPRIRKIFSKHSRDYVAQNAEAVLGRSLQLDESDYGPADTPTHHGSGLSSPGSSSKALRDVEKHADLAKHRNHSRASATKFPTKTLLQSQNRASWLVLLQRIHRTYTAYGTTKHPTSTLKKLDLPDAPEDYQWPEKSGTSYNDSETMVCVAFTEWVWDIMPSDITKPLARTTLGDLIVFAVRLGMQWRSLEINPSNILADGDGYKITSSEINGLGLVVKLGHSGRKPSLIELIPSQAVDKLICGIIPGALFLVDQDIPCVADNRYVEVMAVICSRISPDNKLFELWNKGPKYVEPQSEAISFLCEFLPVPTSSCTAHYFWGWPPNRQSVLRWYEGRFALWRHLRNDEINGRLRNPDLAKMLEYLTYLRNTYRSDSFGLNKHLAAAALDGDTDDEKRQKQLNLIADCRSIFNWTTEWFIGHRFWERDGKGNEWNVRTWYMHLIAAHVNMACHTIRFAVEKTDSNLKSPNWTSEAKHKLYELDDPKTGMPGVKYEFFNAHLYDLGQVYIKNLTHSEHGVVKYMRNQECNLPEADLETAWWVMMLRGIAWTLPLTERRKGEAIPASFYGNDTPVWIT